ncbi:MAG: NAD(P)H-dependent oxidoreductase [Candidatus Omnitrophica bacterium]|nr:NAD(P)H-dependent oxidoreductase [Candidatus Omnitrophota bacterium]
MKVAIIFHSICGNTYLMARAFEEGLRAKGQDVGLYRVADLDWTSQLDIPQKTEENLKAMMALPQATPESVSDADLIVLGSPTHFGNVSAEMKAFMDSTGGLWFHGKLTGKMCAAFASAGNTEGGGDLCLQAIHTYAKYMGMASVPVPVTLVSGENWPALGIIQYSNGKYAEALDQRTERAIKNYCVFLLKICIK